MSSTPLWIVFIGWATKLVLLILAGLSIWSVSILLELKKRFATNGNESGAAEAKRFMLSSDLEGLKKWASKAESIQASAVREVIQAPQGAEAIAYAQKAFLADRRSELSKGLPVLATLGSNAPFIGLFGTVLGIIQSFGALATSSTAMNQVIFSLAEALIATAVGLFVAIPATIGYNVFTQKIKAVVSESESLRDLYLSRFILKETK